MDHDLDALLCERYPAIFRDRHASMTETAMCWGFSCDNGWFALIDTLCEEIQKHVTAQHVPPVIAMQVKEKFGGLRFYYRGGDEYIAALTWYADFLSSFVCETCGAPAVRTRNERGWISTQCEKHSGEDFPLDEPRAHEREEEGADADLLTLSAEQLAARAYADAFHLPQPAAMGWRHVVFALEITLRNDFRYNGMPPVVVEAADESAALRYRWRSAGSRERLAAMFRLAEAYSARCDRLTGQPYR